MTSSRVGGVLFLLFCVGYGWSALDIPLDFWSEQETFTARSLPLLLAVAGGIVSLLLIASPSAQTDWGALARLNWTPGVLLLVLMAAYSFAFEFLGFVISTVLFLMLGFGALGERNVVRMLVVAVPVAGGFWLLLHQLGIELGTGMLVEQLLAGAGDD